MNPATVPELQTTSPSRSGRPQGRFFVLLAVAGVLGMGAGTQFVAHSLAYHPNLGPALYALPAGLRTDSLIAAWGFFAATIFLLVRRDSRPLAVPFAAAAAVLSVVRLGPVYSPVQLLRWIGVYRGVPELAGLISNGILVAGATTLVTAIGLLFFIGAPPRRRISSSHGSARWGTGEALRGEDGLLIGRHPSTGELLRFDGEGHLLTLAPTRSGKGVSVVIPNLLDYVGSMFVLDFGKLSKDLLGLFRAADGEANPW